MAIGSRITQRPGDLNMTRNDLMDRVDGLTPQALSNLIRRDSKRSEGDTSIATALGVSVMWLVYGDTRPDTATTHPAREPDTSPYVDPNLQRVVQAWPLLDDIVREQWGEHAQWVYDNGNYLYFDSGILTSIQN